MLPFEVRLDIKLEAIHIELLFPGSAKGFGKQNLSADLFGTKIDHQFLDNSRKMAFLKTRNIQLSNNIFG
jgi:hypothetical protein